MGFPGGSWYIEDGEIKHKLKLTSDIDFENPIVQEFIKDRKLLEDPPPAPIPDKNNPNKLDWSPVWEWRKRHPGITYGEMAILMNYHPVTIRRALSQLDKEK